MAKLKVVTTLEAYEVDGEEVIHDRPEIQVQSHWNISDFIVLVVAGKEYTLDGNNLKEAIANARNSGR